MDDLRPDLTWLDEDFEPLRAEAAANLDRSLVVCKTCAAAVARYAAAFHVRWHEKNG